MDKLLEFLEVSDTTLKHGLGETAYSYTKMVLKKRSQILSFCSRDVSQSHKAALLYSSVSGPKLFPDEVVQRVGEALGKTTRHDFFVNAAKKLLTPPAKKLVVPASSPVVAPGGRVVKPSFRGKLRRRGRGKGNLKKFYNAPSKPKGTRLQGQSSTSSQ